MLKLSFPSGVTLTGVPSSRGSAASSGTAAHAVADGSLDEGQRTWFQRLFDLHQAHESAFAAFTPGTYAGPVHLVRAAQTAAVYAADDSYGWRAHCSHLTIHQIDGSHTGIWSEADGLAQLLEDL